MAPFCDLDGICWDEMSFQEWKERGETPSFDVCRNPWHEEDQNDENGVGDFYYMPEQEQKLLKKYLEAGYHRAVHGHTEELIDNFKARWSSNPDPNMLSREITRYDYILYPEKTKGKPPYVVKQLPTDVFEKDSLIQKAHFDMTLKGANVFQTEKELRVSLFHLVDASKKYLDWLMSFSDDSLINEEEDTGPDSSLPQTESPKKLSQNQAALVLRYQGTRLHDPQSDTSNRALTIARSMCKSVSGSTGRQLYQKWRNLVIGEVFNKSMTEQALENPGKKVSMRNRLNDLLKAAEFVSDQKVKNQIIQDYEKLNIEYKSLE